MHGSTSQHSFALLSTWGKDHGVPCDTSVMLTLRLFISSPVYCVFLCLQAYCNQLQVDMAKLQQQCDSLSRDLDISVQRAKTESEQMSAKIQQLQHSKTQLDSDVAVSLATRLCISSHILHWFYAVVLAESRR